MKEGVLRKYISFVAFCMLSIGLLSPACAGTVTFKMRSYSPYDTHVKFFSSDRRHVWPSRTRVYVLRDYMVKSMTLRCISGEKICYGAAVAGDYSRYWGRSISGRKGCYRCCFYCDGGPTKVINLRLR